MSKVDSLKKLNKIITGKEATGDTVCEVLDDMFKEIPKKILIASSTTDSTKIFELTVTDDGTITATEVV